MYENRIKPDPFPFQRATYEARPQQNFYSRRRLRPLLQEYSSWKCNSPRILEDHGLREIESRETEEPLNYCRTIVATDTEEKGGEIFAILRHT